MKIALENPRNLHLTDLSAPNQAFVGLAGQRMPLFLAHIPIDSQTLPRTWLVAF
jgi:hypothetical protein